MPRRSSSRNRVATESERNQFQSCNLVQPRDIMHEISRSELPSVSIGNLLPGLSFFSLEKRARNQFRSCNLVQAPEIMHEISRSEAIPTTQTCPRTELARDCGPSWPKHAPEPIWRKPQRLPTESKRVGTQDSDPHFSNGQKAIDQRILYRCAAISKPEFVASPMLRGATRSPTW